jgi:succinate dehydrogenase / fumarate reductase flavoprotein subunit
MSESLRNDGRVWVPEKAGDGRPVNQIPEDERDYFLERKYPAFGNLVPRDIASRAAKEVCDEGRGVGATGFAVNLDFTDAIQRLGKQTVRERYGNLFLMYEEITGENPYETPMRIYPAPHYTMGGLWVDYNLMSTIEGLHVAGEANFSDHGANRLGASALMQGLADGYFVVPRCVGGYLGSRSLPKVTSDHQAFRETEAGVRAGIQKLRAIGGEKSARAFPWRLGRILWNKVGMSRKKADLDTAIGEIRALREEFWQNLRIPGRAEDLNRNLEMAGRVADFLELGELMARDALKREESCGAHFREEHRSEEGEARRNDEDFAFVAAWEYTGTNKEPRLHREELKFENVELKTRSYK